jgi:hypothetical protein
VTHEDSNLSQRFPTRLDSTSAVDLQLRLETERREKLEAFRIALAHTKALKQARSGWAAPGDLDAEIRYLSAVVDQLEQSE